MLLETFLSHMVQYLKKIVGISQNSPEVIQAKKRPVTPRVQPAVYVPDDQGESFEVYDPEGPWTEA